MSQNLEKLIDELSNLTLVEAANLVKELEKKWGVTASAAPIQVAAANTTSEAAVTEKTHFTVVIKEIGDKKLEVIKAVKDATGANLKDSKGIVDSDNKIIKENVPKNEAEEMKKKLESVGAKIDLK